MEFEPLVDVMDEVVVNTTAAREHVGDIEWAIRAIKERGRCIVFKLPYNDSIPDQILVHLLQFVVFWINTMPLDTGVSDVYSLRENVTGMKLDFKKHCRARFGANFEASYSDDITNTMKDRTHSWINLGPTRNVQGFVKCFDLKTGKVVNWRTITMLPMPDGIIKKVLHWGKKSKQHRSIKKLDFLNWHKQIFDWDVNDDKHKGLIKIDKQRDSDKLPAEFPGVLLKFDYDSIRPMQIRPVMETT
jgi:hypothetical protein